MKPKFWELSSYNKRDGKTHPVVARTRNRILDLWSQMYDYDSICEALDVSRTTVVDVIRLARQRDDPRADRPYKHKGVMRGDTRRRQIRMLHEQGLRKREIAKRLQVSPRLVEIRLKEMEKA